MLIKKLMLVAALLFLSAPAFAQYTKIVLSWTAAQGATGYNVYRCSDPHDALSCAKLNSSPIAGTSYTDQSSLVDATTYWYVVTSLGALKESQFSNVAAAYYGQPPAQQQAPPSSVQAGPQ